MTNKWCAMIAPVMVTGAFVFSGAPATHAAPNTFNTALPVPQGETISYDELVKRWASN